MKDKDFRATVLVTDDEASYRNMIKAVLEDAGFEVLAESLARCEL